MVKNTYSDTPELHPNLILGSLHLLVWLLVHPSAWRNYVSRIDPNLLANFALVELTQEQWNSRLLRRLLVQGYAVLPLLVGLSVALTLWVRDAPNELITTGVTYIVALTLAVGLTMASVIGVAIGMVGGTAVGLAVGIVGSLGIAGDGVAIAVSVAIGLAGGVTVSLTSGTMTGKGSQGVGTNPPKMGTGMGMQVGGIVVGVLVGVGLAGLVGLSLTALGSRAVGLSENAAYWLSRMLVVGASFGLAIGWRHGIKVSVIGGLTLGLSYGLAVSCLQTQFFGQTSFLIESGLAPGLASGILFGTSFGVTVVLPYVLAEQIGGVWAGVWAGALGSWGRHIVRNEIPLWPALPLGFLGVFLGLTLAWWRPILFYPLIAAWNLILYRLDERRVDHQPSLLPWHSAFWDELQRLPLSGLDEHLLLVIGRHPEEGQVALAYLSQSRQRWAAQAVQIEIEVRRLEGAKDISEIGAAHYSLAAGELAGPASALLRHFSHLSQDVEAALNQASAYHQRLALNTINNRLNTLLRELTVSSEPYAARFSPIANHWLQLITSYLQSLAEMVEQSQELDNPYVVGVPLTEQQEIFVGRADIVARIEQLLLDRRRPPLLLYGQRRMGKTSLLRNLGRLLPQTIIPLFVDGQRIALASDYPDFLHNLAGEMSRSAKQQRDLVLPVLSHENLVAHPFTHFNEWLDDVEQFLEAQRDAIALLALDEFEMLGSGLNKGRFDPADFLSLLRHMIQHRPHFKVMLAGSHMLDHFQNWASYLINVQVVKVSYLAEEEVRQLIERPSRNFALHYQPEASQRVLELTRGHPALVQLLCYELVTLKNEQDAAVRRLARLADVEAAAPKALASGSFFFTDIQQNQLDRPALTLLRFMAAQGEGAVVSQDDLTCYVTPSAELDHTLALLLQRDLIEAVNGGYRFQVELIRRWFEAVKS